MNQDGSLDTSFDNDGKLTTPINGHNAAYALALQANGKIIIAGTDGNDFVLVRYNTDGSLDSSFDSDGKVITSITNYNDIANSICLQPNGKIVVAGKSISSNNTSEFAIVRYNEDGSIDNSFDSDGKATTTFDFEKNEGNSVLVQPDGKIVIAGTVSNSLTSKIALVRYNVDGSLDSSFDNDGKAIITAGIGSSANSVLIQPDGKIVIAGFAISNSYSFDFCLARYDATLTGIKNEISKLNIVTYPNPANNYLSVSSKDFINQKELRIVITNILGQPAREIMYHHFPLSGIIEFNIQNIPSDIYFVEIQTLNKHYIQRFVKE